MIESKILHNGYMTGSNFFKTQNQNVSNQKNPFEEVNKNKYMVQERNLLYSKKLNIDNFGDCRVKFYMDSNMYKIF
jgi:hypothetical protein